MTIISSLRMLVRSGLGAQLGRVSPYSSEISPLRLGLIRAPRRPTSLQNITKDLTPRVTTRFATHLARIPHSGTRSLGDLSPPSYREPCIQKHLSPLLWPMQPIYTVRLLQYPPPPQHETRSNRTIFLTNT